MTVATVRAAIVGLLQGVPDVGVVHAYERYVREENKFRQTYLYTPTDGPEQLRGWFVRRQSTQERSLGVGRVVNVHHWRIRGYMSLADSQQSELVFDDLIERIRTVFRANPTLAGVCEQNPADDGDDGVQVVDSVPVLFCGVLCHSASLELTTWSYV